MERKGYGLLEFESLWNLARELVYALLMQGMMLDEDGNYVGCPENISDYYNHVGEDPRFKYLQFRECEELQVLTITEALQLTTSEIKERYLSATLPLARKVMRKGSLTPDQYVSDEIPDDYLDELFAMAWKSDLLIWVVQWDRDRCEESDAEVE